MVRISAVVVAGGRSSRLRAHAPAGTPDKPLLRDSRGTRLVDAALSAAVAAGATRIAVVGPEQSLPSAPHLAHDAGVRILPARENPPFSGPAAAVAAGISALWPATTAAPDNEVVLLVAGDMPAPEPALHELLQALHASADADAGAQADGAIAVVDGFRQPLLAALRAPAAVRTLSGDLAGASMRAALAGLSLIDVEVPRQAAADIDTWADARELGFDSR